MKNKIIYFLFLLIFYLCIANCANKIDCDCTGSSLFFTFLDENSQCEYINLGQIISYNSASKERKEVIPDVMDSCSFRLKVLEGEVFFLQSARNKSLIDTLKILDITTLKNRKSICNCPPRIIDANISFNGRRYSGTRFSL